LRKRQRDLLREAGIYLKRRKGQNILVDNRVLGEIVRHAQLSPEDTIVEIGAGLGILTRRLAELARRVISLELDDRLYQLLKKELADYDNLELIQADALAFDFSTLGEGWKVVSNPPYHISTPLIFKLLEYRTRIKEIYLMFQREVANRLQAKPGEKKYSPLSIAVQLYCDVEECLKVSARAFWPVPKVDSTLIKMVPLTQPRVFIRDEKLFFQLVRMAFTHRRKTLYNSLKGLINKGYTLEEIKTLLSRIDIDPCRRPESLSLDEWARLANQMGSTPPHSS